MLAGIALFIINLIIPLSGVSFHLVNAFNPVHSGRTLRNYHVLNIENGQMKEQLKTDKSINVIQRRRIVIKKIVTGVGVSAVMLDKNVKANKANAFTLPFSIGNDRRQLELCLVAVLRLRYWAEKTALSIKKMREGTIPDLLQDSMKGPYVEARLGAKAAVTGKVGGGANTRVLNLASLELKDCLTDGKWWFARENKDNIRKQSSLDTVAENIVESLASIVEFDGLETTQDPSPRSSLTLSMYKDSKALFIQRVFLERTIPSCDSFLNYFDDETREACEKFIMDNYPIEVPFVLKN